MHNRAEIRILEDGCCPYCNAHFEDMRSHFEHPFHYKRHDCGCGRGFMVRVGNGSGHDSFNERWNLDAVLEEE